MRFCFHTYILIKYILRNYARDNALTNPIDCEVEPRLFRYMENTEFVIQNNKKNIEHIQSLSTPLVENLGVPFFIYRGLLDDNKVIYFSNNQDWVEKRFSSPKEHNSVFRNKISFKSIKGDEDISIFIWSNGSQNDDVYTLLYDAGFWNGISIYKHNQNRIDSYHLAGSQNDYGLVDFLLTNMEALRRYIFFFEQKSKELLVETNAITIEHSKSPPLITENHKESDARVSKLITDTALDNFSLFKNGQEIRFTLREAQCFSLAGQGKMAKKIAIILGISHRTVETYLDNIKFKLRVCSRSDVVKEYHASNFKNYFDIIRLNTNAKC